MKTLNKKQNSNSGFSLVELIVVIAIMVVLVAVLAPVFTKYIESSRRSTDVQNANSIAEAVLADAAENKLPDDAATGHELTSASSTWPSAIASQPETKGEAWDNSKGASFTYKYDKKSNICKVYVTGHTGENDPNLAADTGAQIYKDL